MKKLIPYLIVLVLFGIIGLLWSRISVHKKNLDRIKENMEVLLESNNDLILKVHHYQIQDSLNVAQIRSLELTAKEFKTYREEDAKLIKSLKIRNKDLEALVSTKLETRDTILVAVHDTIPGVATFNYTSTWTDLSGTIDMIKDTMQINITNREDLEIVESVTRKRFLGFLWYCKKLESRKVDVVSHNPNTTIKNVSYTKIVQ
nr:MAG TPA: hypothetical protein [Caudoviricetes sp.]